MTRGRNTTATSPPWTEKNARGIAVGTVAALRPLVCCRRSARAAGPPRAPPAVRGRSRATRRQLDEGASPVGEAAPAPRTAPPRDGREHNTDITPQRRPGGPVVVPSGSGPNVRAVTRP